MAFISTNVVFALKERKIDKSQTFGTDMTHIYQIYY